MKKLSLNEWVAVAYKEGFDIGKVEKILAHKVRINFLSENDQGAFIWPRVSDKQDIRAIFIFRRNVEVMQAHEDAKKFNVKNITLIKDRFQAFHSSISEKNCFHQSEVYTLTQEHSRKRNLQHVILVEPRALNLGQIPIRWARLTSQCRCHAQLTLCPYASHTILQCYSGV